MIIVLLISINMMESNMEGNKVTIRPRTFCQLRSITEEEARNTKESYKGSLPPDYEIAIPKYLNVKKEYPSRTKKPLQFSERGHLIAQFDRRKIEEIPDVPASILFSDFINQYKTTEELNNLEITDIFDVDAELLTELQQKCLEFIDATSYLSNDKRQNGKIEEAQSDDALLTYLLGKLEEMKNNEINLKIALNNIEHIKYLSYSADGVKIYFNDSKKDISK